MFNNYNSTMRMKLNAMNGIGGWNLTLEENEDECGGMIADIFPNPPINIGRQWLEQLTIRDNS